ncbi:unnamed protein product [Rotaria socialis]|uniref:Band 7 domain-containing protein n=1 Tax=Rotaria socialis TaxID=392032 RepID=A0A817LE34_9BILA|nr:unnamed protein product [Rotaria socialis]CAF3328600.1 unnamed protein product [Rotaria socialis]CAF3329629.1 unnamed protein product [Rotaria socialis]CAF3732919.1 unnamed protein product [Rotaria socialis]
MTTAMPFKHDVHASNNGNRIHPTDIMASDQATTIPNNSEEPNDGDVDLCGWVLVVCSFILVILAFPITIFYCINVVQEYERAVIFRLGRNRQGGAKGPGLFFILPCVDSIIKVDLRTTTFNVAPQEILTRDSVTVTVDAVIYSRIVDPVTSVTKVTNVKSATELLAQTTLRNILGTKNLHEILSEREIIANQMEVHLDEGSSPWGIKIERVEITDVRLPQSMQRSMAAEAEASREARAKVIAAEGEQKASRQLKEAADVIAESPIALQLRYLQTLTQISAEKNSTIIFPVPIELLNMVKNRH